MTASAPLPITKMAPKTSPVSHATVHRHATQEAYLTTVQGHLVAASGEFVGTFFFLFFSYAGHLMALRQAGSHASSGGGPSSETIVFISAIYSFSLLVNVWA